MTIKDKSDQWWVNRARGGCGGGGGGVADEYSPWHGCMGGCLALPSTHPPAHFPPVIHCGNENLGVCGVLYVLHSALISCFHHKFGHLIQLHLPVDVWRQQL